MPNEYWITGTVKARRVDGRAADNAADQGGGLGAANFVRVKGTGGLNKLSDRARPAATEVSPTSFSIPAVSSRLALRDILGGCLVRWGYRRNNYLVRPGVYALGECDDTSPVLATANYKLSFDALRKELTGIAAWILVLDTRGVNVWCAAGKGTFGTEELIKRIAQTHLAEFITHRTLILPQLGAPGVAAHRVLARTGFKVVYGPVRAADIPLFLKNGMKAHDGMRRVRFGLADRLAVAPIELTHALPLMAGAAALSFVLALAASSGAPAWSSILAYAAALVPPIFAGTLLFPLLLPYLPFRAFSAKGAVLGGLWNIAAGAALGFGILGTAALTLFATPVVAFLAMNFTGASTYTGQRGATIEVRRSIIPMIASMVLGGAGLLALAIFTRS